MRQLILLAVPPLAKRLFHYPRKVYPEIARPLNPSTSVVYYARWSR